MKTKLKTCNNNDNMCTLKEAAKLLGVDYQTAQSMVRRGTIKTFTYGRGMRPRVIIASVNELIQRANAAQK